MQEIKQISFGVPSESGSGRTSHFISYFSTPANKFKLYLTHAA
jgi:hypothetical protein